MTMGRRLIGMAAGVGLSGLGIGCAADAIPPGNSPPAVATPVSGGPKVSPRAMSADELAEILGVNVWMASYEGEGLEVWLEIEEVGQKTLPKRIPEGEGGVGRGINAKIPKGTVSLKLTRREDRQGVELHIYCGGSGHGHGLGKNAFTFAWPGLSVRSTPRGSRPPIEAAPGTPFVIVDYDATEALPSGSTSPPRRVHLKLMGEFAVQK